MKFSILLAILAVVCGPLHAADKVAEAPAPAAPAVVKPAFETTLMTSKTSPRILDVDAPLKGAKELYLVVSEEDGISCDWSDWLEPKLIMADGTVTDLTTLTWKSAKSGSGKVNVGKN